MKARISVRAVAVLLTLSAASMLHAKVMPSWGSESVPQLFAKSSLVFSGQVGTVSQTEQTGSDGDGPSRLLLRVTATVKVDRLYKGDASGAAVAITYDRPADDVCAVSFCITLKTGEYGLFFVTGVGNNYQLVDAHFGRWSVSRSHPVPQKPGLSGLESDLIAGLSDNDERDLLDTVELLGGFDRLDSTQPLLDVLPIASQRVKAAIYVALLRQRDYRRLLNIAANVERASRDTQVSILQDRILFYIGEIHTAAAVPVLLTLATSRSDQLRESVIHALRQTGSPTGVPALIAALDDPIEVIRYDAVLGLATIERRPNLAPSVDAFERDAQIYIDAWKSWWLESGRARYSGATQGQKRP